MSRVLQIGDTFRDEQGGEYLVTDGLGEERRASLHLVRPKNRPQLRQAVKRFGGAEQVTAEQRENLLHGFARERQLTDQVAQLRHQNVAVLAGSGTGPDGVAYLLLEALEGETLGAYLERHAPLSLAAALQVASQIGGALEAIRGIDIAYRDLSTRSVFLCRPRSTGEAAQVKLLALGGTALNELAGGASASAQADQLALAAIVFEMLAGVPAFTVSAEPAGSVLRGDLDAWMGMLVLPPSVQSALKRALSKEPAERFGSVKDFLAALQAPERPPAEAEPVAAQGTGSSPRGAVVLLGLPGLGSYALLAVVVCCIGLVAYRAASWRTRGGQIEDAAPRGGQGAPTAAAPDGSVIPAVAQPVENRSAASGTDGAADASAPVQGMPPVSEPPAVTTLPAVTPPSELPAQPSSSEAAAQAARPQARRHAETKSVRTRTTFRAEPHFNRPDVPEETREAAAAVVQACLKTQHAQQRLPSACRLKLVRSQSQVRYFVTDPDCKLPSDEFAIALEICTADSLRKKLIELPSYFSIVISQQPVEGKASQ